MQSVQRAVSWPLCHGLYGWPGTAFQKEELAVTPEAVKWGEHQAAVTLRTDSAGRSSVPLGILFVWPAVALCPGALSGCQWDLGCFIITVACFNSTSRDALSAESLTVKFPCQKVLVKLKKLDLVSPGEPDSSFSDSAVICAPQMGCDNLPLHFILSLYQFLKFIFIG